MNEVQDYKRLLIRVSVFGVAISGSFMFYLMWHSLITSVFIFTGIYLVRCFIDIITPDFTYNYPKLEAVIDAVFTFIFVYLLIVLIK